MWASYLLIVIGHIFIKNIQYLYAFIKCMIFIKLKHKSTSLISQIAITILILRQKFILFKWYALSA